MSVSTLAQERTSFLRSKAYTLSKIAELATAVAGAITDIYPSGGSATINSANWHTDNTADYPAYYDIAVSGVVATDRADVFFNGAELTKAENIGVSSTTETGVTEQEQGYIRIRAAEVPTTNITVTYWITHKEESA